MNDVTMFPILCQSNFFAVYYRWKWIKLQWFLELFKRVSASLCIFLLTMSVPSNKPSFYQWNVQCAISSENNRFDSILEIFSINCECSTQWPLSWERKWNNFSSINVQNFKYKIFSFNSWVTMAIFLVQMSLFQCPYNWSMWIWKIYHWKM